MSGIITALRFQKRTSDRVNVYLDDNYAFALPAIEAAKLKKGQRLSDEEITTLRLIDLQAKGYNRAIRFLGSRPRSEWEVRQNLKRYKSKDGEQLTESHIEHIIDRLLSQGYLNDQEFAQYWVGQRNQFKPMAPRALRYELRQKGLASGIIDQVLEAKSEPEKAVLDAARKQARRYQHLDEDSFRKKMTGFLQRRGFRWALVRDTLDQVWQELETEN